MSRLIRQSGACFIALVAIAAATFATAAARAEEKHAAVTTAPSVAPDEALARLKAGNKRFADHQFADKDLAKELAANANSQHPYAIILACADSRVAPEIVFDEGIGALFVVRVAGNVVDTDNLGSIEYAIEHLGARLIVVLGHEKCGAVAAAVGGGEIPGNLGELIHKVYLGSDLPSDKNSALAQAIRHNASHQAMDMLKQSEPIKKAVDAHQVEIEAAVYDIGKGNVEWISKN